MKNKIYGLWGTGAYGNFLIRNLSWGEEAIQWVFVASSEKLIFGGHTVTMSESGGYLWEGSTLVGYYEDFLFTDCIVNYHPCLIYKLKRAWFILDKLV